METWKKWFGQFYFNSVMPWNLYLDFDSIESALTVLRQ